MKRPTPASLKKVTRENLVRLGPDRLADILAAAAETRPELKRRLRMELAAEQGADHLVVEIDRRLSSFESSRSRVSWRQRPTFIREVDTLRQLIADKLATLDAPMALERMWALMAAARRLNLRLKDRHGELAEVFNRAADDIGGLLAEAEPRPAGRALADALAQDRRRWFDWLPLTLQRASPAVAGEALRRLSDGPDLTGADLLLVRLLADAAGEVDAFRASFPPASMKDPAVAAQIARRLLSAGRTAEAKAVLQGAKGQVSALGRAGPDLDFDWEGAWIDCLERSGEQANAQSARWASFERTLSVERARDFIARLADFDDVEAEQRAFAHAASHPDVGLGLAFLMAWPALREAAALIEARGAELEPSPEQAETWAAQLQPRHPAAAHSLLRRGAAKAFSRRDAKTCDRLKALADAIAL